MSNLSLWTVASRSLRYFARPHTALAMGIAAATAVLVGALIVGDSVRGSLRKLVVDRLANIECLLQARVFFDPKLVEGIAAEHPELSLAPGILFSSSTVERQVDGDVSRASKVQVLAFGDDFWNGLTSLQEMPTIEADQVAVNFSLAQELGLKIGDEITLRIADTTGVPGDNALGKRESETLSIPRQQVVAIIPDEGIGGVSFLSSQAVPRNVFAAKETLQDILECGNLVNATLALRTPKTNRSDNVAEKSPTGQELCDVFNLSIRPAIEDYGLELVRHRRVFPDSDLDDASTQDLPPSIVYDYLQLSSKQLVMDDDTSTAVVRAVGVDKAARLITYLANSISKVEPTEAELSRNRNANDYERKSRDRTRVVPRQTADRSMPPDSGSRISAARIFAVTDYQPPTDPSNVPLRPALSREVPYSIVVGVDPACELDLEQYTTVPENELNFPRCWINEWLARELDVEAGDWFQAQYFEPETVEGREIEKTNAFMIAGIVPLTEPVRSYRRTQAAGFKSAPTIFNDPGLTPSVPGVTDQDSISKWDLPFKLENEIKPVDDEYWNNHRLTPKVFIPFRYAATNQRFGSRFGRTTAIRFSEDLTANESQLRKTIEEALLETRAQKGLAFLPIRERQLEAASGTTPFDMLFLSLSFFVIVAALLLVFLLFKLGIQQRSSEFGILLAQGFAPGRVRNLLLRELTIVTVLGSLLGIGLGIAYARGIVAGLESWWIGAISTRFLSFFATSQSILIGSLAGGLACLLAIFLGLKQISKLNALTVLRGQDKDDGIVPRTAGRVQLAVAGFAAAAAVGLIVTGIGMSGMARAGSFFGSGMLLLVATLIALRQLIEIGTTSEHNPANGSLLQLAWKAVCRNPLRSTLSLGLLAVAAFLIASMGVFQISPSEKGYGGFDLLGESSQPIYRNIASSRVRTEILGDEAKKILDTTIVPMRSKSGEDASCNNLFQVAQPTILGLPPRLSELHELSPQSVEFEWSATTNANNPWAALNVLAAGDRSDPIPVILDQNTAAWSLKQGASLGSTIRLELENQVVFFRTVGLLGNSVLQGKLLVAQGNFEKLFPEVSGYSFFLVRSGTKQEQQVVSQTLEKGWSDEGLDITSSSEVLARYLGVQNTYISAFQSLGALGLLLGTFGLIAVQVRSVLERKREFALMRAIGFAPDRIATLLTLETAILLGGGLVTGILCAAVSIVPYMLEVGPQVSLLNPILMLVAVMFVGFIAATIAVRSAMKQPILEGLRNQ